MICIITISNPNIFSSFVMMHRTPNGQLVEINKMNFKNDVACFAKITELKQQMVNALSGIQQLNVYTLDQTTRSKQAQKDKVG